MGEGDFLLDANLLEDDDLVDIVELVPIPPNVSIFLQRGSNFASPGIAMLSVFVVKNGSSSKR